MAARCIFCGESPTTNEHVLGDAWIHRLADEVTEELGGFTFRFRSSYRETLKLDRSWKAQRPDFKIRCACKACNQGWMARLDTRVHRLLTPLALGESGVFSTLREIVAVSTWASKVAACAASPNLDHDHSTSLRHLMQRGFPPPGTQVWLGYSRAPLPEVFIAPIQLTANVPPFSGAEGYCTTFKVHHLIFQVAYLPEPLDPRRESQKDWEQHLVKLWPLTYRAVAFPSGDTPPLDEVDLVFLPRAYATGEP